MNYIPVIGTGAVSCAGNGVEPGFQAVACGRDGLTKLTAFDSGLKQVPLCGQVSYAGLPDNIKDAADATTKLALAATNEAMGTIGKNHGLKCGVVLATTVAGITLSEIFYRELRLNPEHISKASLFLNRHEPAAVTGTIARTINACGFHTISTACSTGLHAAGMAMRLIRNGTYDICLAVGADALSMLTVRGFASLMLIDYDGCKPFDKRRVGISLGEGAGALLLASPTAAEKLGIKPVAYAAGWGASADCHHMTAPHPEGLGAQKAVRDALAEAELAPEKISLIATHGTATPDNDVSEIRAMKSVFCSLPPFCSMKRTLGHTLAASGALESVFCISAIQNNTIPATGGFEEADESIGAVPSVDKKSELNYVLKTSFGFGGNNAAVIFSRDPL
jgi:3-oxoacyl-[acyl-carrier-protein] synthase-1